MKALVLILSLLYIISPVDFVPAIPIDDILVTLGTAAYLLTSWKSKL
jgi:hypothetical protein